MKSENQKRIAKCLQCVRDAQMILGDRCEPLKQKDVLEIVSILTIAEESLEKISWDVWRKRTLGMIGKNPRAHAKAWNNKIVNKKK